MESTRGGRLPRLSLQSHKDAKFREKKNSGSSSATPDSSLQPRKIRTSKRFSTNRVPNADELEIHPIETPAATSRDSKVLMTASMLEKLKERLEKDDIKPLVKSESSGQDTASIGGTVSTVTTRVTAADTVTEVLTADGASGTISEANLDRDARAWQEGSEPLSKDTQVEVLKAVDDNEVSDTRDSAPGRELPELPGGDAIVELMEETTLPGTIQEYAEPQNPWQMLGQTDVVEEMEFTSKPEDVREVTARYRDLSHARPKPTDANIFTERKDGRGFVKKTSEAERSYFRVHSSLSTQISGTKYAMLLYNITLRLSVALHGFITGLSLWHSVVVNYVGRNFDHLKVLQYFHPFALPLHTVHYFCLAIVLLSVLNRLDIGDITLYYLKSYLKNLSQFLLLVVAGLVLVALVISLFLGAYEEQISLFPTHPSQWSDLLTAVNRTSAVGLSALASSTYQYPAHQNPIVVYIPARSPATSTVVASYMGLVLARAICCVLSWLIIVFVGNNMDRLKDQIVSGASHHMSRTSFQLPMTARNLDNHRNITSVS